MALNKQGINIPFGQGLDTKTDPNQVAPGKMLSLTNAVFNKGPLLMKRNGFGYLTTPPSTLINTLATLKDNLVALGTNLYSYNSSSNIWTNQGSAQSIGLNVTPVVRTSASQSNSDMAIAANGLTCVAYTEGSNSYYSVVDSTNGQSVVSHVALPSTSVMPRVNILGNYFVVTFLATVTGTPHLQYVAIPSTNPTNPKAAADISNTVHSLNSGYDALVVNNNLYVTYYASDVGGAVRTRALSASFVLSGTELVISSKKADFVSLTVNSSNNNIYASIWDSATGDGYSFSFNINLVIIQSAIKTINSTTIVHLSSIVQNNVLQLFYEVSNIYSGTAIASDYIMTNTLTGSTVGTASTLIRSVGLASKAFVAEDGICYMLVVYGGTYQPTYFLINSTGALLAKVAYTNGVNYLNDQILPSVTSLNSKYYTSYLIKDLLQSVSKEVNTAIPNIYTQTGVNILELDVLSNIASSAEIANTLNITGGFLQMYDGVKPVEQNFHVWPEDITATADATVSTITAQLYNYAVCYEWTDAQGNLHRSAPSVPVSFTPVANTSIKLQIPTLRLTNKTNVRIMIYRWSTAQPVFYQVNPIPNATSNDTTVDTITYIDSKADSAILGNTILYTTGGVIEDTGAPSFNHVALYKSRLFGIDAEDPNTLWFSKQVISGTPVEMSNLLTVYVAPTTGAQGSSGPCTALSAMDDKLIIFKRDSIYYVSGTGPDNTGANNDFTDAVFISSTAGCDNKRSIVMTPNGLMFQSDKGIWMLQRNLATSYIGAAVEAYNNDPVVSALNIPGTNQVRFTLESGTTLMYDYYYDQWGVFKGFSANTSCLLNNLHTVLASTGRILQETPNLYLDDSAPVLLSFTSAWLKLTDLQGFQRAYSFNLLGNFLTPHKLNVNISYDYASLPQQTTIITPNNFSGAYGSASLYGGGSPYGGPNNVEQWRIFFNTQKCQAIQISISEIYDGSYSVPAGAGLTMSGINLVVGAKSTIPKINASNSTS